MFNLQYHQMTTAISLNVNPLKKRTMWDYKNANFPLFHEKLNAFDWSSRFNRRYDIDTMTTLWTNSFTQIAKSAIPNLLQSDQMINHGIQTTFA